MNETTYFAIRIFSLIILNLGAMSIAHFAIERGGAVIILWAPLFFSIVAVTFFESWKWIFSLSTVTTILVVVFWDIISDPSFRYKSLILMTLILLFESIATTYLGAHVKSVIHEQNRSPDD